MNELLRALSNLTLVFLGNGDEDGAVAAIQLTAEARAEKISHASTLNLLMAVDEATADRGATFAAQDLEALSVLSTFSAC
jgi:hypothetical protein